MAKRPRLLFSPEDLKVLTQQCFEHLYPRVQQRLEVLWLISQKVRIHGVSGINGYREFNNPPELICTMRG